MNNVRQYIGARYVPLIDGQWDNTKSYEPLTVVQYQGASYTSRQYVPIGVNITDNEYWAQTGNYNAQVEAYRQEVQQLAQQIAPIEDIPEIKNDITELKKGEMKISVLNSEYAITLIQADGKNIIFDCGSSNETDRIVNFFTSHNVEKLDAVVITHFHGDHWSGFATVAEYCDANTDIFIQMAIPDNFHDSYAYELGYTQVNSIIATNNLKSAIVPIEGSSYTYNDVKLTIWNTNPTNGSIYVNSWANSADGQTEKVPSLNNYSLISKVEYLGNTYVDTGDIEGAAQEIYKNTIGKCNVAKNPHHFANRMGVYEFYKNLNPDIWIATNNIKPATNTSITQYEYQIGYLSRYLMWTNDTTPYLGNVGKNIEITLNNGNVNYYTGYECGLFNYNIDNIHYSMCLPPDFYNENPYCLTNELTLEDLANNVNDIAKKYSSKLFGIGYNADIPISANMFNYLFPDYATDKQIYFTLGNADFEAQYMYAYQNAVIAKIQPAYTLTEPFKRIKRESNGAFGYNAVISNNAFASGDWTFIKNAVNLNAVFSNNVTVPLIRTTAITGTNATNSAFYGCRLNATGNSIYSVEIGSNGTITAKIVNLTTNEVTTGTITNIGVIS